ncbi:MAG TPA: hypothetical protein VFK80_07500, partial [Limnochordia bacterium]|nr:hypothetical protein [Limnochordia bacterium]
MWRARTRVMVPALSLILGLVVSAAAAAEATPSAAEVKAAYAQLEQQQGGPLVASMAKAVQEVVLDGVISPAEAPFAEALTAAAADGAVDIMEFAGLSQAMAPLLMAAAQQPPPVEVPAAPPVPDQLQIALSLDGRPFDARALLPILPDAAVQNALMLEWRTPDGARQGRSLGAPKGSDLVDMGSIESNLGVPPYDIRLVLAPSNDPEGPGTLPLTDWQPVQPQTGGVENIVLPLVAPLARLDLTLAARNGRALAGGQVTLGLQNPRFESGDYGDVTVPVDAKGGATVWVTPGRYRVSAVTWHDPANPGETHDTDDSSFGDDNWLDLQGGGRYAIRRTFADIGGAAVRFTVARDGRAVSPIPEVHVFSPKTNPDGSEPEVAAAKNGEPVTLDAGDYDVWTSWRAADGALYLGRRSVRVDAGSAPSFAVSLQKAATLVWHGLKIGEDPPVDLPLTMDRDIGADVSGYQTIIDASGKPIPPLHVGG